MSAMRRESTQFESSTRNKRYLIHDRDDKYTPQFLRSLRDSGVKNVKLPHRSPALSPRYE